MARLLIPSFLLVAVCWLPARAQTDKPQKPAAEEPALQPAWPEEPEGFKGVQFGWTKDQAESVVHLPCLPAVNGKLFCNLIIDGGGFSLNARFIFEDTGLTQVFGKFPSENYQDVKEMFIAKYGKPHSATQSDVQNRMGATFRQEELLWIGKRVSIVLSRYGSTISDGSFGVGLTSNVTKGAEDRKAVRDKALQ
jgi:hypothetical protein